MGRFGDQLDGDELLLIVKFSVHWYGNRKISESVDQRTGCAVNIPSEMATSLGLKRSSLAYLQDLSLKSSIRRITYSINTH